MATNPTGTGFGITGQTTAPTFGTIGTSLTSTPAATNLTLTPATTAGAINFGFGKPPTATTQAQPTLTLGAGTTSLLPNPTTQATQPTDLTFGTPAKQRTLTFGAQPATTTGLMFGAQPATTGGVTFGTAVPTTGGLTLNTAPTTTPLSFGAPTTTTAPATLNLTFGSTTSAPTTGTALNFGTSTTTSTSLFGAASSSGLFGAKPTSTTTTTTTAAVNKGLGGLDVSVTNKGLTQGSNSPTAAKENILPNELMQTIDGFKEFVKTQKMLSSDIARGSSRPLNRCSEDTASLMEMVTTLGGSVQRDISLADKLKQDTAKALQNAEIAQRTHDTPAGLQYENNMPLLFFMELSENFEHDLMVIKSHIESTEKHIQSMMAPKPLTPQELTMAMSKLHESLVAVAGRLQDVHSQTQQQKEQYINFRKYVLKDSTNVFEDLKINGKQNKTNLGKITSGPTPFGPAGYRSFLSSTLNSTQQQSYGSQNPLAWRNVTPSQQTNFLMGNTMKPPTIGLSFNAPVNLTAPLSTDTNSSFQLQKPPIGNKKGKH